VLMLVASLFVVVTLVNLACPQRNDGGKYRILTRVESMTLDYDEPGTF
jgi:hypothetical protein